MHIAFLTPEYPHKFSSATGGLGTSIKNVANALVRNNIQVTIFIYGQKQSIIVNEDGIRFHFIAWKKYRALDWYLYRKHLQSYINNSIRSERIDVIEVPDWTGISAFINFKCPVVMRLNGSDAYFCHLERRKQKPKNRWFEKKAFKNAESIISVSEFTGNITNSIFGLNRGFSVIPNSVDANRFSTATGLIEENSILYFGTIIRKKGILELAEIFNLVIKKKPGSKLVLAGRDVIDILENKSTLQIFEDKLTENAKKGVQYLGDVPYDEIAREVKKAGVIVLPSFAEALPMTWLEAMAMEKALVTSNIGWANEVMIHGETGYMVDPKNHFEYASKIIRLLENPDLRKELGKKARGHVLQKFDSKVVAEINIKFYGELIKSS